MMPGSLDLSMFSRRYICFSTPWVRVSISVGVEGSIFGGGGGGVF